MTHLNVTLQKQPTPVTCMQTCLAMALGVPVADVIGCFGDRPMNQATFMKALEQCGLIWAYQPVGSWVHSGWYFITVPSLNIRGGHHEIIIHYDADAGCSGITVFDPSTLQNYKTDGSDLISWCDVTPFVPGGRLPQKA